MLTTITLHLSLRTVNKFKIQEQIYQQFVYLTSIYIFQVMDIYRIHQLKTKIKHKIYLINIKIE